MRHLFDIFDEFTTSLNYDSIFFKLCQSIIGTFLNVLYFVNSQHKVHSE